MNLQQDGSADLFANFAGVMILLVVVLMMSVNIRESLVNVQNHSAPQHHASAVDVQNLALLEVAYNGGNSAAFYWQSDPASQKQQLAGFEQFRTLMRHKHPDGIRLRLDDRISSGIYKKILADAAALDIAIYQSDRAEQK